VSDHLKMDILNRHSLTDLYAASKSDSAGSADTKVGCDLRTSTGARLDWEIRSRMDDIFALEDDTER
jgi:hypothetical protein